MWNTKILQYRQQESSRHNNCFVTLHDQKLHDIPCMPTTNMQRQHKFWPLICAGNVGSSKHKSQGICLVQEYIYLTMCLTCVPSTDIQNWHDYNALQLPNSAAQYELIDMSHCHEFRVSKFLLLRGLVG
jgi:hypothetical protein